MKKVFSFVLACGLAFSMVSCNQSNSADQAEATATVAMKVDGMVCETGCAGKIEKTLNETSGVTTASVDFEHGTAVVEYDESVISEEEIVEIVGGVNEGSYAVALVSGEGSHGHGGKCTEAEKAECAKKCSAEEAEACAKKCEAEGVTKAECEKKCSSASAEAKTECEKKCTSSSAEAKAECEKKCSEEDKASCKLKHT